MYFDLMGFVDVMNSFISTSSSIQFETLMLNTQISRELTKWSNSPLLVLCLFLELFTGYLVIKLLVTSDSTITISPFARLKITMNTSCEFSERVHEGFR